MKKILLSAAAIAALSANAWAQTYPQTVVPQGKGPYTFPDGYRTDFSKMEFQVAEKYAANIFVLRGNEGVDMTHPEAAGGRSAVLFGADGALIVDTEYPPTAEKQLKVVRSFTNAPIKYVINTHVHPDHVGSNAIFAKEGARIIASENLLAEMKPNPAAPPPASPPDPAGYPVQTYAYDPANPGKVALSLTLNGETVDVIPLGPGHTGGDSAVRFQKANVIMFGDVIRNFGGPFVDQGNGGSIAGVIATIDVLTKLANDKTTLAPGHGALMHKSDLVPLRAMFVDLMAKTKAMVDAGKTMKEVQDADPMKPYAASLPGYNQAAADRFVEELYLEAKGLPPLVNGRRAFPKN